MSDSLVVGGLELKSRLIVGTGKYKNLEETRAALEASGADMVTVAVRRLDLSSAQGDPIASYLKSAGYKLLPNTAGCYTAEDAVRTCRLARELGMSGVVKVEVIGDPKTLFPDVAQTLEACKTLIAEGFTVLPYTSDDPVVAKRLQDLGCAAVMPLAAPIGSGLGIRNPYAIEILREAISIPLIVDAGVGTASDAAIAMELGCDGVLMNTAIAGAREPVRMARAMRMAVEAGREAFLAGRIARKLHASASSPLEGVIGSKQLG
jgi:thiazole synthase